MRSSKSRSRSKPNRNRSVGNVVNRVFDSSGPESKVRGTPQQIIDKYNQLARDAQLSGDRVAMENFQQHSEHYTRMLAEATREQDQRREQQEAQHRDRQQNQNQNQNQNNDQRDFRDDRADRPDRNERDNDPQNQPQPHSDQRQQPQSDRQPHAERQPQPHVQQPDAQPQQDAQKQHRSKPRPASVLDSDTDVIDVDGASDSGLVETPESKPAKPRARRPRKSSASKPPENGGTDGANEAAE